MTSLAPKTFVICPTSGCGTKIHKAKDVKVESKSKRSGKSSRSQKKGKQPEKGVDINGISIIPLDENELLQRCDSLCDRKVLKGVVDSAKLSGVMNLVKEWQKAAPDDKIISKNPPFRAPTLAVCLTSSVFSLHRVAPFLDDPWTQTVRGKDRLPILLFDDEPTTA